MEIKEIEDKEIWEDFLSLCRDKTFLQSWSWGEFNKAMGNKIWRFGIENESGLLSVVLVIKTKAKRGIFLLVPHGPVIKDGELKSNTELKTGIIKLLSEKLKTLGQKEKAAFARISPICERTRKNRQIFERAGLKRAPIHAHPEASWKLDISLSEEDLLKNMRKTTRYLIRKAIKDQNIEVFQSDKLEDIKKFDKLYQQVVKKQHFTPFSIRYLNNELASFKKDNQISLFFAKYKGEIAACSFVIFHSGIGFYHHAALSPKFNKFPISYYLQWNAIKEAKKRGCKLYDFWGYVSPKENSNHPWAGPTLFKMGFGGKAYLYTETYDLILSPKYYLTYCFEKIRKIKRHL